MLASRVEEHLCADDEFGHCTRAAAVRPPLKADGLTRARFGHLVEM
jgi:hypothetical protein